MGANTRETIDVNASAGSGKEIAIKLESNQPIVAERPMYFNFNGNEGGHCVVGATSASAGWYFAEGYTGTGFQEYLTLQNPSGTPANVTIEYKYRGGGGKTHTVEINARETVDVNAVVGSGKEVSAKLTSDQPIIAERPMYFNYRSGWKGGHNVIGAKNPQNTFYFAEGYTGSSFDEWFTLQNSNPTPANVAIEYFYRGGGGTTQNIRVGASTRETIYVNAAVGPNKEVSAKLTSDQPLVAERPMYFNFNGMNGGHDVVGY